MKYSKYVINKPRIGITATVELCHGINKVRLCFHKTDMGADADAGADTGTSFPLLQGGS